MDTLKSTTTPTGRKHSRQISRTPVLQRRATKGPLDDAFDDPFSAPASPKPATRTPAIAQATLPTELRPFGDEWPSASTEHEDVATASEQAHLDVSFLTHAQDYHALDTYAPLPPFLSSPHLPAPNAPLPTLLSSGHFRAAASLAARLLTARPAPHSPTTILNLFHTRLACLCLIGARDIAAREARLLGDTRAEVYQTKDGLSILPWGLRVCVASLGAEGEEGEREAVVRALWALAGEARQGVRQVTEGEREMWRGRLMDLGVRVAGALVETGDVAGAVRVLEGLKIGGCADEERDLMAGRIALCWLRVGNVRAAERVIRSEAEVGPYTRSLETLLDVAKGDYSGAAEALEQKTNVEGEEGGPLEKMNLAVCRLYTGQIEDARSDIEDLIRQGESTRALLFNLTTLFELKTDQSRGLKVELAQQLAGRKPSRIGWEQRSVDLKL